jgi:hypothetical protein
MNQNYKGLDTYKASFHNETPPRVEEITEIQDREQGDLLCYANPQHETLITRAVNCHEGLVTALEMFVAQYQGNGHDDRELRPEMAAARKALAEVQSYSEPKMATPQFPNDVFFRDTWVSRMKHAGNAKGVSYHWELAGPNGADFFLLREPHHTDAQIDEAAAYLRREQDVCALYWVDVNNCIERPEIPDQGESQAAGVKI